MKNRRASPVRPGFALPVNPGGKHMNLGALKLSIILFGLSWLLKFQAWRHPAYRERLKEKNLTGQFIARDEEIGRWFRIQDGRVTSGSGVLKDADVTVAFKNASLGAQLLTPPINWLDQINAQKEFSLTVQGDDGLANLFAQTVMMAQTAWLKFGTPMPDGSMRYCNMANGGPLFVYVKDGKIIRTTPIDLSEDDGASWTIEARGLKLTPPRKTTLAPHGQNCKSMVYSPDRLLYPMKRIDFDPN